MRLSIPNAFQLAKIYIFLMLVASDYNISDVIYRNSPVEVQVFPWRLESECVRLIMVIKVIIHPLTVAIRLMTLAQHGIDSICFETSCLSIARAIESEIMKPSSSTPPPRTSKTPGFYVSCPLRLGSSTVGRDDRESMPIIAADTCSVVLSLTSRTWERYWALDTAKMFF